jgi:hypothetical protein
VFLWLGISSSTGLNYERAGKKRGSFKWKSYSAILHLLQLLV